jgi:hypothetical protein
MKKKIGFGVFIVLIAIQLIRTEGELTPFEESDDFIAQTNAPEEIQILLKTSCYDCHSNFTKTPWYGQIAPVSWYINDHVNEGREELNFNAWGTYNLKKKKHKLEECWEEIEKEKMPLADYLKIHQEAKLSKEDQKKLISWLKSLDLNPPKEEKTLSLNDGKKWIPNQETTDGVTRMLAIVSSKVEAENLTSYAEMGKRLNLEMKTIFTQCTMKGEGHNQLHLFLIPLVKQFRALENAENEDEAIAKITSITTHLNGYSNYFV